MSGITDRRAVIACRIQDIEALCLGACQSVIREIAMTTLDTQISAQMLEATKTAAAATIAAALISASGRPHSVGEAASLVRDVQWSLWPSPSHGAYKEWHKNFRPDEIHK
jgi:hypothetical protein